MLKEYVQELRGQVKAVAAAVTELRGTTAKDNFMDWFLTTDLWDVDLDKLAREINDHHADFSNGNIQQLLGVMVVFAHMQKWRSDNNRHRTRRCQQLLDMIDELNR
jgi:hypothetical protein